MLVPGRHYNSEKYRFAFNGKESDNEWKGTTGAVYDYGFRIYDSRVAKFLSVDPLTKDYPWYTPYQFAGNKPTIAVDLDGLEEKIVIHHYDAVNKDGTFNIVRTDVDIEFDVVVEDPNTGKSSAVTHLFHRNVENDEIDYIGSFYEPLDEGLKPSAGYDYNSDVIEGKMADDIKYIISGGKLGEFSSMFDRTLDILDRDTEAPDNEMTLEDLNGVQAAQLLPLGGVYSLRTSNGVVVRTGRTKNLKRRELDHLRAKETKKLRLKIEHRTDDYAEQRGLENYVYKKYEKTASSKYGGLNRVKAISDKNKKKNQYIQAATEFLNKINKK